MREFLRSRDFLLGLVFGLVLGILFVVVETAILSCYVAPAYGNDPRANFPGHAARP